MRVFAIAVLVLGALVVAPHAASAQQSQRDATREKLRELLTTAGQRSDIDVAFRQSTKQPYNFVGIMRSGLRNADALEIVVTVSNADTIDFRIYPHYKNAYINLGRARDQNGLMRRLLYFSDRNFLFWGADDTSDVFCGYSFTLESGFPQDAIVVVLRSIRNTDKYVGELRQFVDGT